MIRLALIVSLLLPLSASAQVGNLFGGWAPTLYTIFGISLDGLGDSIFTLTGYTVVDDGCTYSMHPIGGPWSGFAANGFYYSSTQILVSGDLGSCGADCGRTTVDKIC